MNFKKLSLGMVFNATTASLMPVYDYTRDNTDTGIYNFDKISYINDNIIARRLTIFKIQIS